MSLFAEAKRDIVRLSLMLLALILSWTGVWRFILSFDFIALAATMIGGFPMFQEAYDAIRQRRMTMELSMFIAVSATLAIGQFSTGLVITLFVLFAEFLEHQTVTRGRNIIQKLVDFLPRTVTVRRAGKELEVGTDELRIEDSIVVRPGAKIPVDGVVVKGRSSVDQSSITGESMPAEKSEGSAVFAGTFNHSGILEVRPQRIGKDTTFGRIVEIIEKAEHSKAPIQKVADRLSARLVYLALLGAAATYLFTHNVVSAISALIVAGACGVAAGTPLAVLAGIGKMAKAGIIVKGGVYLEQMAKVDTVIFDKTGTLTLGIPNVSTIRCHNGAEREEVLRLAAVAEQHSEHPLGISILRKAREDNVPLQPYTDIAYRPGQGVRCTVDEDEVLVGNAYLMAQEAVEITPGSGKGLDGTFGQSGETVVFVARNGKLVGSIVIADLLREEAFEAVKNLRRRGCRTILLTGDSRRNAEAVAAWLRVDQVFSDMLPEQKLDKVRELRSSGAVVAMVGDGINDAPALIEADVGIAMGSGTDVALESADMALATGDIGRIVDAVRISRQCLRVVSFNFWGTIVVDAVGIVLAFFGYLSPLLAALIHVTSEMGFILNSARLFRS